MCFQFAQCLARISLKKVLKQFYVVNMRVFGQKKILQHVCFLGFIISYANPYKKNRRHKQTTTLQLHRQDVNQFLTSCVTCPFHIFERNVSQILETFFIFGEFYLICAKSSNIHNLIVFKNYVSKGQCCDENFAELDSFRIK